MLHSKYLNKYYLKYGILFIIGLAATAFVDYIQLEIPIDLGQIVDILDANIKIGIGDETYNLIMDIIVRVLIINALMFAGRLIWRLTIFKASSEIEAGLRHQMMLKAERLSPSFYHDCKVGNILNWFTTDIAQVKDYLGWGSIMSVDAFFMTVITIIRLAQISWVLCVISFIPMILIAVWGAFVSKHLKQKWIYCQQEKDKLYDFSQENFTGIRVIKAFVKETQQLHAFAKVARKNKDVNIDYVKTSVKFDVFISIILAVIVTMILGFGGWFAWAAASDNPIIIFGYAITLSPGDLVAFIGLFEALVWPMMALGQIFVRYSRSNASLKRITAFLDKDEDVKSPIDAIKLDHCDGNIKFNHMSFIYPDGLMPSLNDINCEIKAGETIGIIGKIGSGKTTLMNSLLRLYNLDENQVLIDGHDIMKLDIQSLRNVIAYVPQDNFLFSDKISSNISFSDKELSQDQIIEAAEFADVDDNIKAFKDGYDTVSGERGVTLSGGQKQRISIARAYIKNAPIMIMDDSVSAVDLNTEENILRNIKEKRLGKTTIIVASRISTVQHLDRIMVLNDGKLEAFDNHENLLATSPTYKKLAYLQKLEAEVTGGSK